MRTKTGTASTRFSRGYWARLLRFLALCLAVILLAAAAAYAVLVVRWTEGMIHPPRRPAEETPRDVGIDFYEDVHLTTADGLTLNAWYVPSTNGAAVILGHGLACNRACLLPEAAMLARHGFGVLLLDWRAHGESDGDVATFGVLEKQDVAAAVDYLVARPDVEAGRIGALGFSMGGAILIEAAAEETRIRALAAAITFPSLEEELAYQTRRLPASRPLAELWGRLRGGIDPDLVRPVDRIGRISPRPVLLIYGAQDEVIPAGSAQQMLAAAREPKELWCVEEAGHGGFSQAVPQEYEQRLVEFFSRLLR